MAIASDALNIVLQPPAELGHNLKITIRKNLHLFSIWLSRKHKAWFCSSCQYAAFATEAATRSKSSASFLDLFSSAQSAFMCKQSSKTFSLRLIGQIRGTSWKSPEYWPIWWQNGSRGHRS